MVALMKGVMGKNERSGKAWGMSRGRQIGPCDQVEKGWEKWEIKDHINYFIFTITLWGRCYYPHLADKKIESLRREKLCPRSYI